MQIQISMPLQQQPDQALISGFAWTFLSELMGTNKCLHQCCLVSCKVSMKLSGYDINLSYNVIYLKILKPYCEHFAKSEFMEIH